MRQAAGGGLPLPARAGAPAGMLRTMSAARFALETVTRIDLALRAVGVLLVALTAGPLLDRLVHGVRLIDWQAAASYPLGPTGLIGRWIGGLSSQFSISAFATWLLFALPWILGVAAGVVLIRRPPAAVYRFLAARCA